MFRKIKIFLNLGVVKDELFLKLHLNLISLAEELLIIELTTGGDVLIPHELST
jgi:hypothetical protein